MGRKKPTTPRSKVKGMLRRTFLNSRERTAAMKRDGYKCVVCGKKRSEIRLEVHHRDGAHLNEIVDLIYEKLLCPPDRLTTYCVDCHQEEGKNDKETEA
jgi:5-methylcytosine-specific restriction endonuclease McrA